MLGNLNDQKEMGSNSKLSSTVAPKCLLRPLSDNGVGVTLGTESLNICDIVKTPGVVFYRDLSFLEHEILCLSSEL